MDRVSQLRGGAAGSAASSPTSSSDASLAYVSASSDDTKYFSLTEADSTLDTSAQQDSPSTCDSPLPPTLQEPGNHLDTFKIGQTIEAANILSGGVNIFEDNENSVDGNELVIDDNIGIDVDKKLDDVVEKCEVPVPDALVDTETDTNETDTDIPSKETEVQLQIDGEIVHSIDIGNGLYLYRRDGEEELAAVQVFPEGEEPSYKFLKVRENAESNLEVYEEIEVEVTESVPSKATKALKNTSSQGKQIDKPAGDSSEGKTNQDGSYTNENETVSLLVKADDPPAVPADSLLAKSTSEPSDTKLSPLRGGFLPVAYHSTPNKDGVPLTKTMVDQQLHPNRHSDNVKKTIEVNTENCKQKLHEKGKLTATADDNKECSEIELKNIPSLEPKEAIETESPSEVTSSTSNDENMIEDSEIVSASKNNNQQRNQPIHELPVELIQESKLDEASNSKTKDTSVIINKDDLESESKSEVTSMDKPASIPVEDTKVAEKESIETNPKTIPVVEQEKNAMEVADVFKEESCVVIPPHTAIQQEESADAQTKTTQDVSIPIKTSNEEDKEIVPLNPKPNLVENDETDTPKASDLPQEQSNLAISDDKLTKNYTTDSAVAQIEPVQANHTAQVKPITSKEDLSKLDVKLLHESKTFDMTSSKEPEKCKVTEQPSFTESKITPPKEIEKSNGNLSVKTSVTSDTIQEPFTNIHNNERNINTDSSKLSAPLIISEANITHAKLPLVKNDANKSSDELIQLADLGLKVPKEAVPGIIEKGFPDCLKSVADILKPKSYDSKKDNPMSQIDIKKESKIDHTLIKSTFVPKPNTCISKSDETKHNSIVIPITKVESIPSVHDKPKSLLPVFTNKSGDALVNKYVNRAVIIKNNSPSGNIHMAPIVKKTETTVKAIETGTTSDMKPKLLNNNSAVPFGKWTEANKQAYLNKINEPKVISNPNQIKQAKDLNRRDILKKMDSQRQSFVNYSRSLEVLRKANVKNEQTVYANVIPKKETGTGLKVEIAKPNVTEKSSVPLVTPKTNKTQVDDEPKDSVPMEETSTNRQGYNNQDLIDKTIEDLMDNTIGNLITKPRTNSVDEVERKMNALHGIPFVERPVHELPFVERPVHELPSRFNRDLITYAKPGKRATNSQVIKEPSVPKLAPVAKPLDTVLNKTINLDEESEDEILEHEPVTGDMQYVKSNYYIEKVSKREPLPSSSSSNDKKPTNIMEKEINKFSRNSSVPYDHCIKDKKVSKPSRIDHNTISQNEKSSGQYNAQSNKSQTFSLSNMLQTRTPNFQPICTEESVNKTSPSKVQMAYTSAMTAKKYNKESPITVLEDRAVKVMFTDQGSSYISSTLNVQGTESAMKIYTKHAEYPLKSYDIDRNASAGITKPDEQKKHLIKHQRKQVLTPVEETPLVVVPASSAAAVDKNVTEVKRISDENHSSTEKSVMPKKTYLLGRSAICGELPNENPVTAASKNVLPISNAASAIDNLVKAAEMLESQQKFAESVGSSSESPQPAKRGRGRPRKYPLNTSDGEKPATPTPQKKPRVTRTKRISTSDEDTTSSDDEMVMVNWTMGKINEDIVCPICGKLFRSENVVFKHVKHCTGPSPNRSETSERRTSKRGRKRSAQSDNSSIDTLEEKSANKSSITYNRERNPSVEKDTKEKKSTVERVAKERKLSTERVAKERKLSTERVAKERKLSAERGARERKSSVESVAKERKFSTERVATEGNSSVESVAKEIKLSAQSANKERKPSVESAKKERKMSIEKEKDKPERNDIIVIEDTPIKSKQKHESVVERVAPVKEKEIITKYGNIECAKCKKVFRQMSYYVKHKKEECKSQPKKDLPKSKNSQNEFQSVLSCEVCKKDFRKLHHLVQHRIIHEPTTSRRRKSSLELDKAKDVKLAEDQSAGFRCEACDKSFRKLHHLVEHRETHDGHSKNKAPPAAASHTASSKPDTALQCDVCNKTFRKLHHMIEHKEQHTNTKPEKTDEKNIKAAIVTKDIIHECRLCYMVFPNEHSLNRHVGNCLKKKRQSVPKAGQAVVDSASVNESVESKSETSTGKPIRLETNSVTAAIIEVAPIKEKDVVKINTDRRKYSLLTKEMSTDVTKKTTSEEKDTHLIKTAIVNKDTTSDPVDSIHLRRQSKEPKPKTTESTPKNKKPELPETIVIKNTPNKKPASKHNTPVTITRRQKSITTVVDNKETSDDEDVRYMLNPEFEAEQAEAHDAFMAAASHKRNSLQIDRTETTLAKVPPRRTSLQIHSKLLKRSHADVKPKQNSREKPFKFPKLNSETVKMNTSDSDDSDTKYAFPELVVKTEPKVEDTIQKGVKRKSLNEKRKSLTGLAKKKAVGVANLKSSAAAAPPPKPAIKRRTLHMIEHKCDCGQMFKSATLLSHHVTLSHTPPRRSRRRSLTPAPRSLTPAPPAPPSGTPKPTNAKDTTPKPKKTPKNVVKSIVTRKSSVTEATTSKRLKKTNEPIPSVATTTSRKRRKSGFHSGVPVPAKMKALFNKQKLLLE